VRLWIAVLLALLVGLVLGRLGMQEDERQLNDRIAGLQKELAVRHRAGSGTMLAGVRSMFSLSRPELEAGAQARRVRVAATQEPPPDATNAAPRSRQSLSNQIARLKEAWLLRSSIARSNFVTRVGLDEHQQQEFDTTIDAMNFRLGETMNQWVEQLRGAGGLSPENGVRLINAVSQAMMYAYDDLDRWLPPDWRQKAGPRFELMSFVDPEVLTPLQETEGLLPPPGFQ